MKSKMSYKSKRNLIIALIAAVLLLGATVGTVTFIKGNRTSSAAMKEDSTDISTNNVGNNGGNTEGNQINNNDNARDELSSNTENNNEVVSTNGDNNTTNTTSQSTNNNESITRTETAETRNNTGNTIGNNTTTNATESIPNQEYTQETTQITEQPWYTKSIGWVPITLTLNTNLNELDINKAKLKIEKQAIVNEDDLVTTVFKGDIITYKIKVTNVGKIDAIGVDIHDKVPQGTELVEGSIDNNGEISQEGNIYWKRDVIKAGEEVIVSFKVKVLLGTDNEGNNILQIDNTASVNEENTNTTHNPTISFSKDVKVISQSGKELENQIVTPGTRLRYYINLTNNSKYNGITKVTDIVPEGTSLINNTISDGGEIGADNVITWKNVSVPAKSTTKVYFDVTINNNRIDNVSNVAKIGADKLTNVGPIEEPEYTNVVKTPVFLASKKSESDGQKLRENNEVTYVVTITNTAIPTDEYVGNLTGTAKLEDKFWTEDNDKITYKSGELSIKDINGTEVSKESKDEEFLSNIEVTLEAGQTATLTYKYEIKEMNKEIPDEGIVSDDIANNLYWTLPKGEDPSRPENSNDTTNYKNTSDQNDPTEPTADPQDSEKPGLIDTVIVNVEEKYISVEANKIWIDDNNAYGTRPESIEYTLLYKDGTEYTKPDGSKYTITSTANDDWKAVFTKLKESDNNGRAITYKIKEKSVKNYTTTYSEDGLTAINKYTNPDVTAEKKVQVVLKTENGEITTQDLKSNRIVEPGTRLRYTVKIINSTNIDGYVNVTDMIPEGTTLYNNVISNSGVEENGMVKWSKVKVPSNNSTEIYFDVTVDNNRKETVENVAKVTIPQIPEDPQNPEQTRPDDKQVDTNKVKTPVFIASKKSVMDYDLSAQAPKLHETNEVTYVVTITNTATPTDEYVGNLTGTAKLEDKFWTEDIDKMTYKSGELVIKDANGTEVLKESKNEDFLSNIEVTLKAGQTATLTYKYEVNKMQNPTSSIIYATDNISSEWDEISNNLYWTESKVGEPSRPGNSTDATDYKNTVDQNDPTEPTADPQNPEKSGLIDTVIVHVEEEYIDIEATKAWEDDNDEHGKRPNSVNFTLYKDDVSTGKTLSPAASEWKAKFEHLRRTDANGNQYIYSIKEDRVPYYINPQESYVVGTNNKVKITNYIAQLFAAEKTSSKEGNTIKENEDIDYTITVYNFGKEDGTTSIMDSYRNNDANKVKFKSGTVEYFNSSSDTEPTSKTSIDENYLKNKITLNIKSGGKVVIKYVYTAKRIDENKTPDQDGIIRDKAINDLFWAKNNDSDPDDENYPTDEPIDTVEVKFEKEYTSINATKIWEDSTDTSKRPNSIEFIVQKNGTDTTIKKTLTAANKIEGNNNKWQVTFDKLVKFDENGTPYNYTVKEANTQNYVAKYSEDGLTITNVLAEDIDATVITTNARVPEVPMDVVFVLDISSSMLDDPTKPSLTNTDRLDNGRTEKNNKVASAKAINMVKAVNTAINAVIDSNPNNRVAVQLYNSKISSEDSDYYLIDLQKYSKRSDGEYIKFNWSEEGKIYPGDTNRIVRYDGILTTTVNDKTGIILEAKNYEEYKIIGTYTQAGVQRGEAILTGASNKQVSGKTYTRVPVMVLVTDGDPTHYNKATIGKDEIVQPAATPVGGIGKVREVTAEYYYYTMKQLEKSKEKISTEYSKNSSVSRTCRLYTIGIGMQGSMADVLLDPTSDFINNKLVDSNNVFNSIENYRSKQTRLKNLLLQGDGTFGALNGNYTDKSFNTSGESLLEMQNAFHEVISDANESIKHKTIGSDRIIDISDIAENRKFSISINGKDFDGNTVNINKNFDTFTQAKNDTTLQKYIKESYYIDLSELKNGTVTVTYVVDNQI